MKQITYKFAKKTFAKPTTFLRSDSPNHNSFVYVTFYIF